MFAERKKMHWKSSDVVALAQKICEVISSDLTVEVRESWGDHDSERVYIWYNKFDENESDFVAIAGFDTESSPEDTSDCKVEMIEMTSRGGDSGSGVVTDHEDLMLASFRIRKELEKVGWRIVNSMRVYF